MKSAIEIVCIIRRIYPLNQWKCTFLSFFKKRKVKGLGKYRAFGRLGWEAHTHARMHTHTQTNKQTHTGIELCAADWQLDCDLAIEFSGQRSSDRRRESPLLPAAVCLPVFGLQRWSGFCMQTLWMKVEEAWKKNWLCGRCINDWKWSKMRRK